MHLNLATKFSIIIGGVVALAVISSALAAFTARQVAGLMAQSTREYLPGVRAGAQVEIALLRRYNYLALYVFGEPPPKHREDLESARIEFDHWYQIARRTAGTAQERDLLDRLDVFHTRYRELRGQVVTLQDAGRKKEAQALMLGELREVYLEAYAICERLVAANEAFVAAATADADARTRRMTWMVIGCVAATLALGGVLLWYFLAAVVLPLRRMMAEVGGLHGSLAFENVPQAGDELKAIGAHLRGLMADVLQSRSAVEDSRRRLLNAEKLAGVGKLAASVAHEIRNPLTAVKMLLFSIQRTIEDDPQVERKLHTVSEEIRRLESIVGNFLEFSKPPTLRLRRQPLLEPIEKTLQLFQPRLAPNGIELVRRDAPCLPEVMADTEQLKQVFLNLLENAAEAAGQGGRITVSTSLEQDPGLGPVAVVRVEDSGAGLPEAVRARLFEPFLTTKKEGTGLGLCIAGQIVMGHQGRLVLESSSPQGTCFAVFLPTVQGVADE